MLCCFSHSSTDGKVYFRGIMNQEKNPPINHSSLMRFALVPHEISLIFPAENLKVEPAAPHKPVDLEYERVYNQLLKGLIKSQIFFILTRKCLSNTYSLQAEFELSWFNSAVLLLSLFLNLTILIHQGNATELFFFQYI